MLLHRQGTQAGKQDIKASIEKNIGIIRGQTVRNTTDALQHKKAGDQKVTSHQPENSGCNRKGWLI
ncbi:hypothetical protein CS369_19530 [Candidatus Symbiopectobacterium sp. 'North America']|nr:hypothetical protein [Candidatus Symbiopectobacterium sp. 'North America']